MTRRASKGKRKKGGNREKKRKKEKKKNAQDRGERGHAQVRKKEKKKTEKKDVQDRGERGHAQVRKRKKKRKMKKRTYRIEESEDTEGFGGHPTNHQALVFQHVLPVCDKKRKKKETRNSAATLLFTNAHIFVHEREYFRARKRMFSSSCFPTRSPWHIHRQHISCLTHSLQ